MSRTGRQFVALALVAGLAIPLFAQTRHRRPRPKPATVRPQAPVPPPQPAPEAPPVPLRPEQMAPTPPQVTFQGDQLTIVADNSTLSSILSAVRARTGAHLEMPPDVANDRVVARLGPGDPRDVVAALLQGSRFDYILLGSESDPNALSQIILTARAGTAAGPAVAAGVPGMRPAPPPPQPPPPAEEEDTADTQPEPEPQPAPQAPQMPAVASPIAPSPGPPEIGPTPEPQNPDQSNTPQVKTPEQLLRELQRMRQQQQQNQQQQPPNTNREPPQ